MKIKEVKSHLVNVHSLNLLFVSIHTDEGISGVGEGTATYGAGSLAVDGAVKELAPLLVGEDPFNIELLCETLRFKSFWGKSGGPYIGSAISGIEQALWDIKGKALNTPVYEMLGGCVRDKIRVYANTWLSVGWRTVQDYVDFALESCRRWFTAIKLYPSGWRRDST
jgi:galactonate dehydratase